MQRRWGWKHHGRSMARGRRGSLPTTHSIPLADGLSEALGDPAGQSKGVNGVRNGSPLNCRCMAYHMGSNSSVQETQLIQPLHYQMGHVIKFIHKRAAGYHRSLKLTLEAMFSMSTKTHVRGKCAKWPLYNRGVKISAIQGSFYPDDH